MSLIFKDNHIVCDKCGNKLFEEIEVFGIEPLTIKTTETTYKTIQNKYIIKCFKCNQVIHENEESIMRKNRK